jgi:hypothetical protein
MTKIDLKEIMYVFLKFLFNLLAITIVIYYTTFIRHHFVARVF